MDSFKTVPFFSFLFYQLFLITAYVNFNDEWLLFGIG
jgi:hypothetical protein